MCARIWGCGEKSGVICALGESVAESGGRLTNVTSVGSGVEVWAGGRVPDVAGVPGWESASRC